MPSRQRCVRSQAPEPALAMQCADLLESGFNDGVPVFDGGDGVWMADGQDGLPHACGFVQGNTFLFQLLHELLQGNGQKQ